MYTYRAAPGCENAHAHIQKEVGQGVQFFQELPPHKVAYWMGRCKEVNGMTEFCILILIVFTIKIKTQINGKNDQQKEYSTVSQKSKKEKLRVI